MPRLISNIRPQPSGPAASDLRVSCAGLLVCRRAWRLSWRGKFLALVLVIAAGILIQHRIYSWLAITRRVSGDYLVVEGWIHSGGFESAVDEFKKGRYEKILTSGCIANEGSHTEARVTYAEWGATRIKRLGISEDQVQAVPCWVEQKDRTFHSALAVKQWFLDNHVPLKSIDVVTLGPHARRTRLLFQKALGNQVAVGVIATQDESYDAQHWWRSSEGVREILGETVAYLYARLFFHPSEPG